MPVTQVATAPPALPMVFMQPATIAAYFLPMSWQIAQAGPIVRSLMEAEDRLVSTSESHAVVVLASCDQLQAAVDHTHTWLGSHRCPDDNFGLYLRELISACRGLCAIMTMVVREVPEGQWYKRFPGMTVCGEGELIKTFLLPGQAPRGQHIS